MVNTNFMNIPPLPDEFVNVTGLDLVNLIYDYLNDLLAKLYLGAEDEVLRALPQPLADFWILHWLDYENIQAGLPTYFMNAHGRQAKLAIDALRRCGADDIAECLEEALAIALKHQAAWTERTHE